jgi:hypothetical protein
VAVGDVKSGVQLVAAGAFLDIRPPSGEEWVVHNIHAGAASEVYFFDGTNSILVDSAGSRGWLGQVFHCTNSMYYQIKNVSAGAALLGYDGIATK